MSAPPFDFVAACRAIARAGPLELERITRDNPRMKRLADRMVSDVAASPPLTATQREGIRAIFRGVTR